MNSAQLLNVRMQEQETARPVGFPTEYLLDSSTFCLSRFKRTRRVPVLHNGLTLSRCYWCNWFLFWALGPTACVHLCMPKYMFWQACNLERANNRIYATYKQDFKSDSPKFVINICIRDSGVKHWGGWKVLLFFHCSRNNVIPLYINALDHALCFLARTWTCIRALLFYQGFVWSVVWKPQFRIGKKY